MHTYDFSKSRDNSNQSTGTTEEIGGFIDNYRMEFHTNRAIEDMASMKLPRPKSSIPDDDGIMDLIYIAIFWERISSYVKRQ